MDESSPPIPPRSQAVGDGASGPPKGLKRRLRWSTRGGEIIRSDGPHEVSVSEGTGNAVGRVPIPQSEEPRSLLGDSIAFGLRRVGVSSTDRFEAGETLGAPSRDRFEHGQSAEPGTQDRYAGGEVGGWRDRFADLPSGLTPSDAGDHAPVVGVDQLKDRFAAGAAGSPIRDRLEGGGAPDAPRPAADGPSLDAARFNDFYVGGPGAAAPDPSRSGPAAGSAFQDRNLGGATNPGIRDRMLGAQGPEALTYRNEGSEGQGKVGDRYLTVPDGGVARDRIDLPEGAETLPTHPHRGTRKPVRIDELLRQVPKPVFQPVEIFKDVQGITKRMTGIRSETADIEGRLSPALSGTASDDPLRKANQWLKKKLPK
jgi:hypothetical protein